jgi:hypothetical protein
MHEELACWVKFVDWVINFQDWRKKKRKGNKSASGKSLYGRNRASGLLAPPYQSKR